MDNLYRYTDKDAAEDFTVEQLGRDDANGEDNAIVIVTDPNSELNGQFLLLPRSKLIKI